MAGKPSGPNIERPDRLCFVDKPCSEKAVLQRYVTAQAMFIPMIKYDPNNIERSGTMYVIDEFENNPKLEILEKIANIRIYWVPAPNWTINKINIVSQTKVSLLHINVRAVLLCLLPK